MRHSPSSVKLWRTCPRQYHRVRVLRDVKPLPRGIEADRGEYLHKAIEDRLEHEEGLPPDVAHVEALCVSLESLAAGPGGQLLTEKRLALDESLDPCDWKQAWFRGVADVLVLSRPDAWVVDWKTGKRRVDWFQLDCYALAVLRRWPEVQRVTCRYEWIATGKRDERIYERSDEPELAGWLVGALLMVESDTEWVAKPSGLCRAWCPVTDCEHNGRQT